MYGDGRAPYRNLQRMQEDSSADCGGMRRQDECMPSSRGIFSCIPDRHFGYVGEGSGGYTKQPAYNYVGDGRGTFEKSESVTYGNYRPRPCAVIVITLALVAGGGIGVLLYKHMGSRLFRGGLGNLLSGPTSDGCYVDDCMCRLDDMQAWDRRRVDWCCSNKGIACPGNGLVKPRKGVGQLVGTLNGCSTECHIFGHTYDCQNRINFTAFDTFKNRADPCTEAYKLVLGQCSFCSKCILADTSCGAGLKRAALSVDG